MKKGFSIKSKLIVLLLLASFFSAVIFGLLGWQNNQSMVTDLLFDKLASTSSAKADELEIYFRAMNDQVVVLSGDDMVINAMINLNKGFRALRNQPISPGIEQGLEQFYSTHFFPKLAANLPGQAEYGLYRPDNPAGVYLQYHYLAANPHSNDLEKPLLDQAEDGSAYSAQHAYYHPRLRNIVQRLGFDDLILVSIESGDIVYNVSKQTDFASNLLNGPYRKGNEAAAFEAVRSHPDRNAIQLTDFELYRANYGFPTAFWSAPIYNGPHLVGALLVQLSLAEINKIMTDQQDWRGVGLGETGESYLVGSDLLLRSDSRFLLEDPAAYIEAQRNSGVPERTLGMIQKLNTSILLQKINTVAGRESTQGHKGIQLTSDYRGESVIAAYQPVNVESLQWGVVTEINQDEAFAPLWQFRRNLLIAMVVMALIVTFAAMLVANRFLAPITQVIAGARQTRAGHYDQEITVTSTDELGELAQGFNSIMQSLLRNQKLLAQKDNLLEHLWLNLLPDNLVTRVPKESGWPIETSQLVEESQQVSALSVRLAGIQEIINDKQPQEAAQWLHELNVIFDEAASSFDVERFPSLGQHWVGICGLNHHYLDHCRRNVDTALAAQQGVERFNQRHNTNLQLCMGLHLGAISIGVVGTNHLSTQVWGKTFTIAEALCAAAAPNSILVSPSVYEQLSEHYQFRSIPCPTAPLSTSLASAELWVLTGVRR